MALLPVNGLKQTHSHSQLSEHDNTISVSSYLHGIQGS